MDEQEASVQTTRVIRAEVRIDCALPYPDCAISHIFELWAYGFP